MEETTIQIIGIVAVIASLLGWIVKRVINYFIKANTELVIQSQKNVENFVNTINHNQTKMNDAIDKLSNSIEVQTDVFTRIINDKVIPMKKRRK